KVCCPIARCKGGQVLVEKYETHAHKKAESYRTVEFDDTPQCRELQVEDKHVAQSLFAYSRKQQGNLSHGPKQHTKGQSHVSLVALTKDATGDCPDDDADMIRGGGKCRP